MGCILWRDLHEHAEARLEQLCQASRHMLHVRTLRPVEAEHLLQDLLQEGTVGGLYMEKSSTNMWRFIGNANTNIGFLHIRQYFLWTWGHPLILAPPHTHSGCLCLSHIRGLHFCVRQTARWVTSWGGGEGQQNGALLNTAKNSSLITLSGKQRH